MSSESKSYNIDPAGASDESIQEVHANLLATRPEPKTGFSVLPLFILGFVSTMIFFVSIYFVQNRGGFSPLVHDERFDPASVTVKEVAQIDPVAAGKKLYSAPGACVTCHQATGQGIAGVYPPLVGSDWVIGSEERLVRVLLHGLNGPIKVVNQDYNGAMPAFGAGSGYNYSDEKIAQVLTYIRQEWGNSASPVTAEKVAQIRTQGSPGRTTPWTAAELESFP